MKSRIQLAGLTAIATMLLGATSGCGGAGPEESASSMPRVTVEQVSEQTIVTERGWSAIIGPLNTHAVKAPEAGQVETLLVREGDRVQKDQQLVQMDEPELSARLAVLEQRRSALAEELARWERLARADAAGPGEVDAARLRLLEVEEALASLEARLRVVNLRAPVNGRVTEVLTAAGATVAMGEPLLSIEDSDTFGMAIRVAASEAHYFAEADALQLIDTSGKQLEIERIVVREDPLAPGFMSVRIWVNSNNLQEPVDARLTYSAERKGMVVPWTAVARENEYHWVAVIGGDDSGTVERRRVKLGAARPDGVEITEGLTVGERVIRFEPRSQPEGREVAVHESR